MKIFSWMQNKLNGKNTFEKNSEFPMKKHPITVDRKEEFCDWPQGLLAIGTFGNSDRNFRDFGSQRTDSTSNNSSECTRSSQEFTDFTEEGMVLLQKELTKLLDPKPLKNLEEDEGNNLPLDKFLNCHSSLEIEKEISDETFEDSDNAKQDAMNSNSSVVPSKSKHVIGQTPVTFLLKKMFVSSNRFSMPSPRDQLPESKIEKIMRRILHKKICPQNSSVLSSKKILENKPRHRNEDDDQATNVKITGGCKWVKTDSEYIVLEI